jgi:hypothetical protein
VKNTSAAKTVSKAATTMVLALGAHWLRRRITSPAPASR